jgi:hypothetical protein
MVGKSAACCLYGNMEHPKDMATKKPQKLDPTTLKTIAYDLGEFHMALGLTVVMLTQTEKALKKNTETLRVNALAFRGGVLGLQRMQRKLFAKLEQAGVLDRKNDR